jgi:hypothetical protein
MVFRIIKENLRRNAPFAAMPFALAPADLDLCARTVALMDDSGSDPLRAPLAWVIRNRLVHAASASDDPPCVASICGQILREATGRLQSAALHAIPPLPNWCRFYAVTCHVWAGDLGDETGGALFCHRHDRAPAWARSRAPTALIGSYLFFR